MKKKLSIIAGVPDLIVYYLISQYVGMGVVGLYMLYRAKFKIGWLVVFYMRSVGSRVDFPEFIVKGKVVDVIRGAYSLKPVGKRDIDLVVDYDKPPKSKTNEWVYVAEKEFKVKNPVVTFGKGTYHLDLTKPCYRKHGYTVYPVDVETGNGLLFGGEFERLPPQEAQRHLKNGALRELLFENPVARQLIIMFVVVTVAFAVASFFGGFVVGGLGKIPVEPVAEMVGGLLC